MLEEAQEDAPAGSMVVSTDCKREEGGRDREGLPPNTPRWSPRDNSLLPFGSELGSFLPREQDGQ